MRISDWSSDVCSSDLLLLVGRRQFVEGRLLARPRQQLARRFVAWARQLELGRIERRLRRLGKQQFVGRQLGLVVEQQLVVLPVQQQFTATRALVRRAQRQQPLQRV